MSDIQVKFTNPFYGPVPGNPETSKQYLPVDRLPQGDPGIYTLPADYAIPTSAIVVEGESTYRKPADQSPPPTTQVNPAIARGAIKKQATRDKRDNA